MKKILSSLIMLSMTLSFTGCGNSPTNDSSSNSVSSDKKYNIGICQLVQHEALDSATKGFQDALTEALGDKVAFDVQNAQGDSANCATIINQFVANNDDLILANATAPLQAAAAATNNIPILGTSVTDYGVALAIDNWSGATGINISGTSDCAPLDEQAAMIKELFPNAKTVGLLYCSAEPNSKYQVEKIHEYLKNYGYNCEYFSFVDSNDIAAVTTGACDKSDVIYIPTDNTAASNTEIIKNICIPAKKPIITGEEGPCKVCGVATLSISYYDIGRKTGEMAYDVLVNGADISKMEIAYAKNVEKKYNKEICAELGITVPENYKTFDN
ncbi:MAG: ABC transporter substrate-binding protein [Clostridiales bacterium]|nr:ABC transporter substrate-binding protein [Clostridiales bacterium]